MTNSAQCGQVGENMKISYTSDSDILLQLLEVKIIRSTPFISLLDFLYIFWKAVDKETAYGVIVNDMQQGGRVSTLLCSLNSINKNEI